MAKVSIRESRMYPVFFMIILSALLTFILAMSYQLSRESVEKFREVSFQTRLLSIFIPAIPELNGKALDGLEAEEISKLYKSYITAKSFNNDTEYQYYQFSIAGKEQGYVFPVSVKGLWSTIHLLVAIKPDFSEYMGIKIISQGETPGLGARITEEWFQKQFAGKSFLEGKELAELEVIAENEQPKAGEYRQITGATVSSRAVISGVQAELMLLYKEYENYRSGGDK